MRRKRMRPPAVRLLPWESDGQGNSSTTMSSDELVVRMHVSVVVVDWEVMDDESNVIGSGREENVADGEAQAERRARRVFMKAVEEEQQ